MSYVAPWAGVTALAVTFSWLGVRGVVRDTVSERSATPPMAGPVIHASPSVPQGPTSIGSPTVRPGPAAGQDRAPTPTPEKAPARPDASGTPRPAGKVRSYATRGGQAAMSFTGGRVRLVSATPNPGYETRVTEAGGWLRVDFLTDKRTSSVVATWYDQPATVKVYEY
ncbi:hypothetical protein AGRA3207_006355 [Actinomadura graeca]|uniref:Secreted protein n=1 Tax=Actinomadura graeca TaxID=2750812 RepID=A0ABX8R1G9_9ACTN|nr:hypothetical protein [Actinomadura graeca]QXJ24936.1 hypothetical protein AGRA3207_006355 [Actinomadura graeca]